MQRFNVGKFTHKGTRGQMEDGIVCVHNLCVTYLFEISIYGIYDGHGGDTCMLHLQEELIDRIREIIIT